MKKEVLFGALFVLSSLIIISGAFFSIYAFVNNVAFRLMGADFPGFVFGLAAVFLGIRYTLSLSRLKKRVNSTGVRFDWNNFKRTNQI